MAKPWEAEIEVDEERAAALIDNRFPALAPARVFRLGSGWDNAAFLVNDEYVFRFPRRAFAVSFFEKELRLLSGIGGLPLPIPKPLFMAEASDDFPWPFAGYRQIEGRTACAADLTDEKRLDCAAPLGRFLRALHSIPVNAAADFGAGPDVIRRMDIEYRTPYLRRDIEKIRELGTATPPSNWETIAGSVSVLSDRRCLVHGDLYVRHLIVGTGGMLAGVIDWGDSHLGHPAIDLAIAHTFLPPCAHPAFREAYGDIDDVTWSLARWRALVHTSMLVLFATDVGDVDLLRESSRAYRHLEA